MWVPSLGDSKLAQVRFAVRLRVRGLAWGGLEVCEEGEKEGWIQGSRFQEQPIALTLFSSGRSFGKVKKLGKARAARRD